ncbi:Fic family protein [Actinotalea sp. C106]|uniref:Fic/DOC family protein n=1 Tax=Actinotalea sp. C106 TaxID=2908644 RepID=UPI002028A91D|nr:Fic family protein [Actinotalea sp. C106]
MLRNRFTVPGKPYGEDDPQKLRALEEAVTAVRLLELAESPIAGRFDYEHMKAIHAHVFGDVYEWAGEERVGPVGQFMTKDGHAYYGGGPHLTVAAEQQYARLAHKDLLRGLGHEEFVGELAESWGELNVIHSFREGNTRTQFVFFSQLAQQAGYRLDTAQFAPGAPLRAEFVAARFHSQDTGSNDRLTEVLRRGVVPLGQGGQDPGSGAGRSAQLRQASYPRSGAGRASSSGQQQSAGYRPGRGYGTSGPELER